MDLHDIRLLHIHTHIQVGGVGHHCQGSARGHGLVHRAVIFNHGPGYGGCDIRKHFLPAKHLVLFHQVAVFHAVAETPVSKVNISFGAWK